jgi:hypothetical protein
MAENAEDALNNLSAEDFSQGNPPSLQEFTDAVNSGSGDPKKPKSGFATAMSDASDDLAASAFAAPKQSLMDSITRAGGTGTEYFTGSQTDRFTNQEDFNPYGFNPGDSYNTDRAIANETWGTAMSKAFDSAGTRFGNTFTDWWKDYGRMADALFSMDWDKMRPDESTMIDQYYADQKDMNKNFVFASPEDEDSIFSKKFAADMISNSGFALGTFAALGLELTADAIITAATVPAGGEGAVTFGATFARLGAKFGLREATKATAEAGLKTAATSGYRFGDVLKGFSMGNKTTDEITAAGKVLNQMDEAAAVARAGRTSSSAGRAAINETFTVFSNNVGAMMKSKSFGEFAGNFVKGVPLLGTGIRYGEKVAAGAKAGLGAAELTGIGLQGLRRVAQELNMSGTEASFEAVTSYGDTLDKMVQQYKSDHDGQAPPPEEFATMRELANKAAGANYNTNLAILLATNKIQFGTLFNRFTPANRFMRDFIEEGAENILKVEAKAGTKLYQKGFTGAYGTLGQVAKDFGKKEAFYQFGKAFSKDMLKFELSEGLQENFQEASAQAWKDYYVAKYKGVEYTLGQAFGDGFKDQFSKQGLKTFLMGAMTGAVIRIPTAATQRTMEKVNNSIISSQYKNDPTNDPIKNAKKQLEQDIETMNTLFKRTSKGTFEQNVFNFANQTQSAQEQTEAASKGQRYEFENGRDNAILSAVSAAKRTNSIDALERSLRQMGDGMANEEFEKSFGVKLEDTKYSSAQEFTNAVANDVKKYSEAIDKVKRKMGPMADPLRYEKGSRNQFVAAMLRRNQEEAVHIIAINSIKGEMTVKRSQQIAQELMNHPGISASSDYALRVLTNGKMMKAEMGNINAEINVLSQSLKADGLDTATRQSLEEQIADKREELKMLNEWSTYFATEKKKVTVKDDEGNDKDFAEYEIGDFLGKASRTTKKAKNSAGEEVDVDDVTHDMFHSDIYMNFLKLMQIKNKQAGLDTQLQGTFPVDDALEKLVDYMRLDKDTKDYMRSVDVMMNKEHYTHMLEQMTDGEFKYKILEYLENVQQMVLMYTKTAIQDLNIQDPAEMLAIIEEIGGAIFESEAYKNLIAITSDPKMGIHNSEYADKQIKAVGKLIAQKFYDVLKKYGKSDEAYTDIPDAEFEGFKTTGNISYQYIIEIAKKKSAGGDLSDKEKAVYADYADQIDELVNKEKEEAAAATATTTTTSTPGTVPVASSDAMTLAMPILDSVKNTIDSFTNTSHKTYELKAQAIVDEILSIIDSGATTQEEIAEYMLNDSSALLKNLYKKHRPQFYKLLRALENNANNPPATSTNPAASATPAAAPAKTYQVVDTGDGEFTIKDETGDYYYHPETGQAFFANTRAEAEAKLNEINGVTPPAAPASAPDAQPENNTEKEEEKEPNVAGQEIDDELLKQIEEARRRQEQGDGFAVEGNERSGFDVVDNEGDPINNEPLPSEEAAEELALSATQHKENVAFASTIFKSTDPVEFAEFVKRALKSMDTFNTNNGKELTSLQEYYATPNGKRNLNRIIKTLTAGKPTETEVTEVPPIEVETAEAESKFDTSDTESAASLTLQNLEALNKFAEEFKRQEQQTGKESAKFVEEDSTTSEQPITESGVLDDLRDILGCFE